MKHYIEKLIPGNTSAAAIAPAIRAAAGRDDTPVSVVFSHDVFSEQSILPGVFIENTGDISAVYDRIGEIFRDTSDIRVVAVEDIGTFCIGYTKADADHAMICCTEGKAYEPSAQKCCMPSGRLSGKVSVVTGSAQGFGEGIAEGMAAEGSYMIIADLNIELASKVADGLNDKYGEGTAAAVKVNVADEDSVREMVETTVLRYGGLDIFVSNAGVVRAGDLEEMNVKDFSFVTDINYLAYFLCVKYASRPMKIAAGFAGDVWSDIIQINSKSGLEGSNKNFAYAGSKFGGIGLTESFALELVDHAIKVNSVCPGNYYDGPLWSDPEKGLFVSYLRAGKIPGAKTIEDVRQFYLSKSPIKRGCLPEDVTKAILYCVEQKYETGQAIPVTGGQKMLK